MSDVDTCQSNSDQSEYVLPRSVVIVGPLDEPHAVSEQASVAADILRKKGTPAIPVPNLSTWWPKGEVRRQMARMLVEKIGRFYVLPGHEADADFWKEIEVYKKLAERVVLPDSLDEMIEKEKVGGELRSIITTSIVLKRDAVVEARNLQVMAEKKSDAAASVVMLIPFIINFLKVPFMRKFLRMLTDIDAGVLNAAVEYSKTDEEVEARLNEAIGITSDDERVKSFAILVTYLRGLQYQWDELIKAADTTGDFSACMGDTMTALLQSEGINFKDPSDMPSDYRRAYEAGWGPVMEIFSLKNFMQKYQEDEDQEHAN